MLIGYGMPAVATVTLTGATWLSADQGSALFDGKPGRASRIRRTSSLAITFTLVAIANGGRRKRPPANH